MQELLKVLCKCPREGGSHSLIHQHAHSQGLQVVLWVGPVLPSPSLDCSWRGKISEVQALVLSRVFFANFWPPAGACQPQTKESSPSFSILLRPSPAPHLGHLPNLSLPHPPLLQTTSARLAARAGGSVRRGTRTASLALAPSALSRVSGGWEGDESDGDSGATGDAEAYCIAGTSLPSLRAYQPL